MQSGILASDELRRVFGQFTADKSLFALPITISNESLQPLEPVPYTSSDFKASLPALAKHLQPKTPIYLLLRRPTSATATADLVAVTFIPYNAPVRSKTLFASTRSTLVRDLGLEKFSDSLFVTEVDEVLDPSQWDDRSASDERAKSGHDTALLSTEERELQRVKRAEEEERHGTGGRDLMGEGGSGAAWSGAKSAPGASRSGITMKITDDARAALGALKDSAASANGGYLVQLSIDIASETLTLLSSSTGVQPGEVPSKLPSDQPSYTFYHFPSTSAVIFVYTCPGTAKVKERMIYASSRNGVIELARGEGAVIKSRLEAGVPEDVTEQRLQEEAGVNEAASDSAGATTRQGFARPKRPGRR